MKLDRHEYAALKEIAKADGDPSEVPAAEDGPVRDLLEPVMAIAGTALPARATTPAHRDGNVLRWLCAYTVSLVGDGVYFVALGWSAQKTAGPAEVGLVMAAGAAPRALLMFGGGVLADRIDPRRVILGSDALRCLLILAVGAGIALTAPALWMLVTVALAFGAVDALFVPAVGALPARITGHDQLARVTGMRSLSMRLGQVAGPPIGGLAMGLGGAPAAFTVAGALFALSLPWAEPVVPGQNTGGPAIATAMLGRTDERQRGQQRLITHRDQRPAVITTISTQVVPS